MENENQENQNQEFENLGVGEKQPPLEAKKVKIVGLKVEMQKDKEGKDIQNKLTLTVQYLDSDMQMDISKAKVEKAGKTKIQGLWVSKDKDGKIPYNSTLACLLRFYNCSTISEIKDKEIDTTLDDEGYIVAKAY